MRNLLQELEHTLKGRVCLMGLGNPDQGDDAVGVRVAEELIAASVPDVYLGGANPERHIGHLAELGYDHLVFIDAVDSGMEPGSIAFMDAVAIDSRFPQISTHKISLGLMARWAEANGRTKAWLIGVQPESLKFGEPLTTTLAESARTLSDVLRAFKAGAAETASSRTYDA